MTRGSGVHDDVSRHFGVCSQCASVQPESVRVAQPEALRRTVPDDVLVKLCLAGRSIYRAYLRWLAEPDE